jgi:hypothetical protein
MYNRNYGGFDYVRIHSELLTPVLNRKSLTLISVTDGYTRPFIGGKSELIDEMLKNKPKGIDLYEIKPKYEQKKASSQHRV